MKKSIYLDSNDFSDLSEPEDQLRDEDKAVLCTLREATTRGTAIVLLSPPLLSEAVHATESNKEHSLRRASLMHELCGTNFVAYPTNILKIEVTQALSNSPSKLTLADFLSSEGEWFGSPYTLQSLKETRQNALQKIDEHLKHLPRAERRKIKSQLNPLKAGSRSLLRTLIMEGRSNTNQTEFPLNMLDQDLYLDWFLGDTTDVAMRAHMHDILCNPYVLFRHVIDEIGHRDQLYNLVRKGGASLSANLEKLGQHIIHFSKLNAQMGQQLNARDLANEITELFLKTIVERISEIEVNQLSDAEFLEVMNRCPSASTLIHVLRAYIHTLVQSNLMRSQGDGAKPAKPKQSDFGDLMHVFYAPYVDIFRCDARFGEHLKNNKLTRGRIASRRGDILHLL